MSLSLCDVYNIIVLFTALVEDGSGSSSFVWGKSINHYSNQGTTMCYKTRTKTKNDGHVCEISFLLLVSRERKSSIMPKLLFSTIHFSNVLLQSFIHYTYNIFSPTFNKLLTLYSLINLSITFLIQFCTCLSMFLFTGSLNSSPLG